MVKSQYYKLAQLRGEKEYVCVYEKRYCRKQMTNGLERIEATVTGDGVEFALPMAEMLVTPLSMLYVVHVPVGSVEPGRHQSSEIEFTVLTEIMRRHKIFLNGCAGFDLWIHSETYDEQIVWDSHNIMYCYGPLAACEKKLINLDYLYAEPALFYPHAHLYNPELSDAADNFLSEFQWTTFPLADSDGE